MNKRRYEKTPLEEVAQQAAADHQIERAMLFLEASVNLLVLTIGLEETANVLAEHVEQLADHG